MDYSMLMKVYEQNLASYFVWVFYFFVFIFIIILSIAM